MHPSRLFGLIATGFLVFYSTPVSATDQEGVGSVEWLQLMQKGTIARKAGNLPLAENYWRQALEKSDQFAIDAKWQDQNLRCLMTVLAEEGKCSNLEKFLQLVIAKRKGDPAVEGPSLICPLDSYATTLVCVGKLEEAEATYKQALRIAESQENKNDHAMASILIHLAQLNIKTNKLSETEAQLRKALVLLQDATIDPLAPVALLLLASTVNHLGRPMEAVGIAKYAQEIAARYPQSPSAQLAYNQVLAQVLMNAEQFDQAIGPLAKAKTCAKSLGRTADFDELNKQLNQAIQLAKLKPRMTTTLSNKGVKWQVPSDLIF